VAAIAVSRPPDILIRTAPPLSATSDAPLADVAKPPESASNHAEDQENGVPAEMTLQEKAEADAAKSTEAGAEPDAAPAKPAKADAKPAAAGEDDEPDLSDLPPGTPTWAVREISKARKASRAQIAEAASATKAAKEATDAAAAAQAELAAIRAKLETTPPADAKPTEQAADPAADPRPTRDQFYDPDSYDEALTGWAEREGMRKVEAKAAAEAQQAQAAANEAETLRVQAAWDTQRTAAIEKHPDYVKIAESDDHAVTPVMATAMMGLDNGTDVAMWLGQNHDDSARIAAIASPVLQIVEICKVAAQLATPKPRAARARPIEPVDRGTAPADTSAREPSMDEWAERRTKEILNGRKPFFSATERTSARH
jgi:hypothetical protein